MNSTIPIKNDDAWTPPKPTIASPCTIESCGSLSTTNDRSTGSLGSMVASIDSAWANKQRKSAETRSDIVPNADDAGVGRAKATAKSNGKAKAKAVAKVKAKAKAKAGAGVPSPRQPHTRTEWSRSQVVAVCSHRGPSSSEVFKFRSKADAPKAQSQAMAWLSSSVGEL